MVAIGVSSIAYVLSTNDQQNVSVPIGDSISSELEAISMLPKYDRPDLAVSQNLEMTRDPSTKTVPVNRSLEAFQDIKSSGKLALDAISGVNWTERGPDNVGGRTRALMFDPNDGTGSKVWAGGVAGGLWFNNNITSSSSTWQNVNDFWANLAISTIDYDPTNTQTFYVGTGEGFFNADAVRGAGIWKSTNGGTSWSQLSSTDNSNFHYIQKLVVTPTGALIVATREGLYRSTNGGSSFSTLFTGRFADIEVAANGDIYASEGIFSTGVVRKSTNDGVSWSTVTPATGGERIELAVAPSNANVVYAVASSGSNIAWFRKTTNGGSSWTTVTVPNYVSQSCTQDSQDFARGQAWYDLIVEVHPTNSNIAIVGGIDLYKTTNGGSSWGLISYWTGACDTYVHADQHAIQFSPVNANTAIFGNDGGVFYSSNVGSASNPTISARNNGYNVTQFYAADQINSNGSNFMIAGAQDNGSHRFTTSGINSTTEVTGGDGAFCHIDQNNSTYQVTSYVYNSYYRSTNGGSSFSSILNNQTYGRFINPTDYDDDAKVLYCGANEDQFIKITGMTGSTSPTLSNVSLGGFRVSAIKVSPYTNNRIFLGTGTNGGSGGSKVFRVENANGSSPTVTEISTASLPVNGYISSIDIGTSDNQVIVTYSNYGITSVWETRNGGSSWSNREGNLPDIPVRWALYNPLNTDEVLLATELGVWSTDNVNTGSPVWGVTNTGLANVRCDMLQYRDSDGVVLVATHGRGVYTATPFTGGGGDTDPPTTPTGLASSGITSSGFNVNWNASSDNVGVTGYNVYLNGSLDGTTASTSYSFTGLAASTSYTVAVEATDAAGNISGQASINVTTAGTGGPCTASVTAFPYSESFESGIGSWTQNTGDDLDWTRDSGGTPSNGTGPSTGAAGSWYMYIEASGNGAGFPNKNAIFTSPCMDVSGLSAPTLEFSYHMNGTAMGTLIVQTSTDGGNSWTNAWSNASSQGDQWNQVSLALPSSTGIQVRFNGTTGSSWSSDIAIDDVSVSDDSDTQAPTTPTGLSSSAITTSSFDVSWTASTDNVGVTGYNVYLNGSLDGTTTSTIYSFSGLAASTTYAVAVEANDAAGNTSGQASINVTTASVGGGSCTATVSSFPYSESFESGIGAWTQNTGDDLNWTRDSAGTPSNGTGPATGSDGSWYMYIEASGNGSGYPTKNAILTGPCMDVSGLATPSFSFSYHMNGTAMGNLIVETSVDDGSTWTSAWSISGSQGDVWNDVSITLPSSSGIQVRFNGTTGSSWSSDIAIDNVSVSDGTTPSCPEITFGTISSYGGTQDADGTFEVQDAGATLFLENNTWKYISYPYSVTANTVIDFEFRSTSEGEIHGIGFDNDNAISSNLTFKVHGNQNWGLTNYDNYSGTGWVSYSIPVGSFYTGSYDRLFFTNDNDAGSGNNSYFRNVVVHEGTCGPVAPVAHTNSDGIVPVLGTEGEFEISTYPNPVVDQLNIRHSFKSGSYSIISITGKVMGTGNIDQDLRQIDTSELASGIYLLKVSSDESNLVHKFKKR